MRRYLAVLAALLLAAPVSAQLPGDSAAAQEADTITQRYLEAMSNDSPGELAPEPGTMALLATGLIGMMGATYRQRRKRRADPE
jgi:hypothetical protein